MTRERTGKWYFGAALAAALLAVVTVASKAGVQNLGTGAFLFWMFIAATIFILPFAHKETRRSLSGSRIDIVLHTVCVAAAWLLYALALTRLSASLTVFIGRVESIFIIGLAVVFFRESFGITLVVATVCATLGTLLISRPDNAEIWGTTGVGTLLVLASAFFFASAEIFARRALNNASPVAITFLRNLCLIPLFGAYAWYDGTMKNFSSVGIGAAVVAACAGPFAARIIYLNCIRHIPLSHAAVMAQTEPLFALLLGTAFLNETVVPREAVGSAFILIGAAVLTLPAIWSKSSGHLFSKGRDTSRSLRPSLSNKDVS